MNTPWTVVLQEPRNLSLVKVFHVEEREAVEAIAEAQQQAYEASGEEDGTRPEDWRALFVTDGHHVNYTPPDGPDVWLILDAQETEAMRKLMLNVSNTAASGARATFAGWMLARLPPVGTPFKEFEIRLSPSQRAAFDNILFDIEKAAGYSKDETTKDMVRRIIERVLLAGLGEQPG